MGKEERWKRKRPVPQRTSLQTQTHGTTFAGPPERPHSYESANTPSALNAGTRSGYSGRSPFPLSLSDPFAGEPSAGFQLPPLSVGVPPGLIFASKVCFICGKNTTGETALSIPPECFSIVFYNRGRQGAFRPRRDGFLPRRSGGGRGEASGDWTGKWKKHIMKRRETPIVPGTEKEGAGIQP